jgi:hypothetical protein
MAFVFTGNIALVLSLLTDLSTVCVGKPIKPWQEEVWDLFSAWVKIGALFPKTSNKKEGR